MTFSVTFVYMKAKRKVNFVWALQKFEGIFFRVDGLPKVIITKRDLALMDAMKYVFHEASSLLCQFHIDKNVKVKCQDLRCSQRGIGPSHGCMG